MKMCCFHFVGFVVLDFKRKGLRGDWSVESDLACPCLPLDILALSLFGFLWCCVVKPKSQTERLWEHSRERSDLCVRDAEEGTVQIGPPPLL